MSNFHTSLDAALRHDPRWLPCGDCDEHPAGWLESPDKFCGTCGVRVIDGRGVVHPCPICPDPRSAA